MATTGFTRRSSYGPSSPDIGERGARTRQQLKQVALALFADHGFHDVLVEDIAEAGLVSRATLYQYFESKEQLLIELVNEAGASLKRMVDRIGPLGPMAEGFDNLHWWLGEWAWVYDKYSTVLIEWARLDSPTAPIRTVTEQFTKDYVARLSARFRQAGVSGIDPDGAALAMHAVVERYNYLRHTRNLGISDDDLIDNLAVALQLFLFPETEPKCLVRN